jgi:Pyridine nucleotide-disulphide oxidoreductase
VPSTQTRVIVGAGMAGAKAAEALRDEGFEGSIALIGQELDQPCERPPLSKDYLRGESPREKAFVHPGGFYAEQGIELRTSTTVDRIASEAREVVLDDSERLGYDRLLLATGAEPRRLSISGADLDGVHYLRDLRDADRLAARLRPGARAVVIGGGVVAGVNVNVWDVVEPIEALIRSPHPVDVGDLRDPDVPLERLTEQRGSEPAARQDRTEHESDPDTHRTRRVDLARHALTRTRRGRRARDAHVGHGGQRRNFPPDDLR